jgi:hypothetical protein
MSIWYDILIFLEKLKNYYNCFLRTYKNICKKKISTKFIIIWQYFISTKVTQKFQKYKFSAIKRLKIIWKKGSAA